MRHIRLTATPLLLLLLTGFATAQTTEHHRSTIDPIESARRSADQAMAALHSYNFPELELDGLQMDLSGLENFHGPLSADLKLPHGTWWREADLVKRIGLSGEQQKRIEDLFLQNKIQLIHLHASLQEEELLMQPTLDANPPDEAKALAQISKIADTRADLEKANAKMLLGIRGVLTGDQWTKLQAERTLQQQRSTKQIQEMMERMQKGLGKPHAIYPAPKPDGN